MGFWHSRALAVATELELAELLADGPLPVEILASRTQTDPLSLFRLMRALESLGIFKQVSPRLFANTPASECLRRNAPASQWAPVQTILSVGHGQYEAWAGLLDGLRTGKTAFDAQFGCPYWQWLQRNPGISEVFNETTRAMGITIAPAVAAAYDWGRFPVIADIGGGIGGQLTTILNAHSSCRGILFDRADVISKAPPHDRVERIGGDFFKSVPAGADAYILRWVIHDWNDPDAIAILKNVRQPMKAGSRVMLIEELVPDPPKPTMGMWLDPHMLIMAGGRERTAAEYRELYANAGLALENIVSTASLHSIIVGRRRD
jgi:hypothetical protein